MTRETEALYGQLSDDRFALNVRLTEEEFIRRVERSEILSETLRGVIAAGCYWGELSHDQLWVRSLERIACPSYEWRGGFTALPRLALYPGLLLLYSGGICCIEAKKYKTFAALVMQARCRMMGDYLPVGLGVGTHGFNVKLTF